ncbi:MAG: YqgE/AlgH family protein [Gammaproteobacteria bacterium]|nr:YqgE/AlgH family protein [Gammaproteobacteria bacterium]MBK79496.1 YqgE/AlgH family protein [Gammaproteobacteria bacterium]|tara:strand:- start:4520 stop:5083 length:564 start_codon:yes stop_codon:yes gene_type:complete
MTEGSSLKNHFLIAMPAMTGSYFGDTVTYLCEHNDDGAMGIVVNKPSELSLVELLGQLGMPTEDVDPAVPVMDGGPVARDRGFILHSDDARFDASLDLGNGIMLTAAREVLEAIGAGRGPARYLVALGYAGWDGGQLEEEIKDNAWLTCPAERLDVVFEVPFENRVLEAAAILGIDFRLMSGQAGHA